MSFHYYLGYVFTALKMYESAMKRYRLVLIHPTRVIHKCIVDAYKKYILVSLISGYRPDFPTKCDFVIINALPNFCSEYIAIANAMEEVRSLLLYREI